MRILSYALEAIELCAIIAFLIAIYLWVSP